MIIQIKRRKNIVEESGRHSQFALSHRRRRRCITLPASFRFRVFLLLFPLFTGT